MIYIGADHKGFELKGKLLGWLKTNGYEVEDCGAFEFDANDDYPDFAKIVAERIGSNQESRGIIICATGVGVDIVANRNEHLRCGLGFEVEQVKKSREDDDINILSLAASFTDEQTAFDLVKTFLETQYQPTDNHQRRLGKLN